MDVRRWDETHINVGGGTEAFVTPTGSEATLSSSGNPRKTPMSTDYSEDTSACILDFSNCQTVKQQGEHLEQVLSGSEPAREHTVPQTLLSTSQETICLTCYKHVINMFVINKTHRS